MAKANEVKKEKFLEVTPDFENQQITFALGDGQNIVFPLGSVSQDIVTKALYHGFNQKIRDAAASFGKEKDYDGAFEAMQKVVDNLQAGNWNGGGAGGSGVILEDLAYAIATMKGADMAKAMAVVKAASTDQRKVWAKNAKIAKLMADAKAARLAKAADDAEDLDIDLE